MFSVGCETVGEQQILPNTAFDHHGSLLDIADATSQQRGLIVAEGNTGKADNAGGGFLQSASQTQQSGFSGTGGADDPDKRSYRHGESHILQPLAAGPGIGDIVKFDNCFHVLLSGMQDRGTLTDGAATLAGRKLEGLTQVVFLLPLSLAIRNMKKDLLMFET